MNRIRLFKIKPRRNQKVYNVQNKTILFWKAVLQKMILTEIVYKKIPKHASYQTWESKYFYFFLKNDHIQASTKGAHTGGSTDIQSPGSII